jgi:excisionase family DNA binding protein
MAAQGDTIQRDTLHESGWGAVMPDDAGELLTKKEVAALLRISERKLERMTASGEGPPSIVFGRSRRWFRRDVVAWLEAHREGG